MPLQYGSVWIITGGSDSGIMKVILHDVHSWFFTEYLCSALWWSSCFIIWHGWKSRAYCVKYSSQEFVWYCFDRNRFHSCSSP
jgi:hypothetical protein